MRKTTVLLLTLLTFSLCACNKKSDVEKISEQKAEYTTEFNTTTNESTQSGQVQDTTLHVDSTSENDTMYGFNSLQYTEDNIVGNMNAKLTEYFDNNYFYISFYDDLQRYPDAYVNTKVVLKGYVYKIISYNTEKYEFLLAFNGNSNELIHVVADNTSNNQRVIEGDMVEVRGVYSGIDTITHENSNHIIPSINSIDVIFFQNESFYDMTEIHSKTDVGEVAKYIFGNDIEVRDPKNEEERNIGYIDVGLGGSLKKYFVVENENQSNSRLDKYRFYTQGGYIDTVEEIDSYTERTIRPVGDGEHFLLFSTDFSTYTFEVGCYKKDLTKVWEREFENIESCSYDFTSNNVYVCVLNDLYIINTLTGEDTFRPVNIGDKSSIVKLNDGLLTTNEKINDNIIFYDNTGNVNWRITIPDCLGISKISSIQFVEDKIVLNAAFIGELDHILVIDKKNGQLLLDCVPSTYYNNSSVSNNNNNYETEEEILMGTVVTEKDPLNVRQFPNSVAAKIGQIAKGTMVTIISETNGWYEILFNNGTGYVNSDFIEIIYY